MYSNGNGEYYFRGEITNNYVQLGTYGESKKDQKPYLWQILGIESDGSVKIRSTVGTTKRYAWDDRYNEEINSSDILNGEYVKNEDEDEVTHSSFAPYYQNEIEVIGNIFDNPELLNHVYNEASQQAHQEVLKSATD